MCVCVINKKRGRKGLISSKALQSLGIQIVAGMQEQPSFHIFRFLNTNTYLGF